MSPTGSWRATALARTRETAARSAFDLLVLGDPDRNELFERLRPIEDQLGRSVQVTVRSARWLEEGSGSFHDTVVGRPTVELALSGQRGGNGGGG